jgi:release factor glutamine methyltransferase
LFEPREALFAVGRDPLVFYRRIVALAARVLAPGGSVVFETHTDRAQDIAQMLRTAGFRDVRVKTDYAGRPRTVEGSR